MGIKLSLSGATKKAITRTVQFRHKGDEIDPGEGPVTHDGDGDLVWEAELEYIDAQQIADITEAAAKRRMLSVKKKDRGMVTDWRGALEAICKRSIKSWKLTLRGCHTLEMVGFDYAKADLDAVVDFSPENLADMIKSSMMGGQVYACLNDFNFWFPEERAQLGNSVSGPPGSTAALAATPA